MPPTAVRQEGCENGIRKGTTPFNRRIVDKAYRKKEFQLVSVDALLDWADIGTKAHTSERLTSLLGQMPLLLREEQANALGCLPLLTKNTVQSHGGDGEGCDG